MSKVVILAGARTPFGKLGGRLASVPATGLGAVALRDAIRRSGVDPEALTKVVGGQVLQAGAGQNPARQAAFGAGLPQGVVAETVNRVCGSGMLAMIHAERMIRLGEHHLVGTVGMESMSQAPYLDRSTRFGRKMGHASLEDSMVLDGLTCAIEHLGMGEQAQSVVDRETLPRELQDAWALRSHQRAITAIDQGRFAAEIAPVNVSGKGGETIVDTDEGPRRETSIEVLAALKPVFTRDGTITAGNAPGVNDGAASMVLASDTFAHEHGLPVRAKIVAHADAAAAPGDLAAAVTLAARRVLERAGMTPGEVDLWEINEAFASVAILASRALGIDEDRVNVNGGAVALGHPIGASGARIVLTLIEELQRRGGGIGLAAICSGGGQGDAMIVEVPA